MTEKQKEEVKGFSTLSKVISKGSSKQATFATKNHLF